MLCKIFLWHNSREIGNIFMSIIYYTVELQTKQIFYKRQIGQRGQKMKSCSSRETEEK